ncbi:MAG: methylated-DNA--[protein]-cysteine S-methyltransferase [Kiritimatiellae bacterium]|nr:methylated-DNA--[protein]-cysteine S-methyltransferase [Kiritimatiellia bacterium]
MPNAAHATIFGRVTIVESGGLITHLFFACDHPPDAPDRAGTPLLRRAFRQLEAYLNGKLEDFDLPLGPQGTDFQSRVWKVLRSIPYGHTLSYKEVACRLGNPGAARAVGMANNRNPIPIFIPCHRVIGADGSLVGYGSGIDIKARLLEIERAGALRHTGRCARA